MNFSRLRWFALGLAVVVGMTGCSMTLNRRAERDLRQHDFQGAVQNLDRLLSRDLPDNERAAYLVSKAVAIEEGRLAEEGDPVALLSEAIGLDPINATAFLIRAQMLARRGERGAITDADSALALAGAPDAEFLAAAGDVYLQTHEPESAVSVYERALTLEPEAELRMALHRNLAIAYRDLLEFEAAVAQSARYLDDVRQTGAQPSVGALMFHATLHWLNNDINNTVAMLNSGDLPPSARRSLIEQFADPNLNAALARADRTGR